MWKKNFFYVGIIVSASGLIGPPLAIRTAEPLADPEGAIADAIAHPIGSPPLAEVARLAGERLRQQLTAGQPGPEGSAGKLTYARLNQEISGWETEFLGADGLTYDDWTMRREGSSDYSRGAVYAYLRSKGNSIEGGTSEILRNIIAERVLGLPPEPRVDTRVPWKDLPR